MSLLEGPFFLFGVLSLSQPGLISSADAVNQKLRGERRSVPNVKDAALRFKFAL